MNKQDKPRICEVLGVEVGEQFKISSTKSEYYINECGEMIRIANGFHLGCGGILETIINHPDRIIHKPRFTEEEIARAKNLLEIIGAGTISRPGTGGTFLIADGKTIALRDDSFFSICPGQSVHLSEICGGEG